jgi:hypothetical protein
MHPTSVQVRFGDEGPERGEVGRAQLGEAFKELVECRLVVATLGLTDTVRLGMEAGYPGLHLVGRNGMHRYNNQDHSMVTAMLTVENILAGKVLRDPWRVNQDAEYHEAGQAGAERIAETGGRQIPKRA